MILDIKPSTRLTGLLGALGLAACLHLCAVPAGADSVTINGDFDSYVRSGAYDPFENDYETGPGYLFRSAPASGGMVAEIGRSRSEVGVVATPLDGGLSVGVDFDMSYYSQLAVSSGTVREPRVFMEGRAIFDVHDDVTYDMSWIFTPDDLGLQAMRLDWSYSIHRVLPDGADYVLYRRLGHPDSDMGDMSGTLEAGYRYVLTFSTQIAGTTTMHRYRGATGNITLQLGPAPAVVPTPAAAAGGIGLLALGLGRRRGTLLD